MRIAVIGLGIMGAAVTSRLLGAGHDLLVYNRTREKASEALNAGAAWCDSPASAAAGSDIVITFVTDSAALESVSLGDEGVLAGLRPEAIHCDMSTIAPVVARRMDALYRTRSRRYIQAPVLGSRAQILDSSLLVFAGGNSDDIDRCEAVWSTFARRVWRFETVEQSSALKLSCNMLIAQMIVGLGQTMALAGQAGVDPATVLEVLGESGLASPMYAKKGKGIVEGNYAPNFVVRNLLKDLRLASDYAVEKSLPMPVNAATRELFVEAVANGLGDEDYSAVVKTILRA